MSISNRLSAAFLRLLGDALDAHDRSIGMHKQVRIAHGRVDENDVTVVRSTPRVSKSTMYNYTTYLDKPILVLSSYGRSNLSAWRKLRMTASAIRHARHNLTDSDVAEDWRSLASRGQAPASMSERSLRRAGAIFGSSLVIVCGRYETPRVEDFAEGVVVVCNGNVVDGPPQGAYAVTDEDILKYPL